MSHLSESLLNEYLDERLAPADRQAAEAHLHDCADCRLQLEELQSVFKYLGYVPERPLNRDLAPAVLTRLQRRRLPVFLRIFLAVQAGFALGILSLMARLGWTVLQPKDPMVFSLSNLLALADQLAFHPVIDIQTWKLPALPLPAPVLVLVLVFLVLLLCMGNVKLLKNGHEFRNNL